MDTWQTTKILILVKTYPTVSKTYQETVCTAGVTSDGKLIRIYPVKYRYLNDNQKFEKFTWVEARIKKSDKDSRVESYKVEYSSITKLSHLDSKKHFQERYRHIKNHLSASYEEIQNQCKDSGISLGIFRPKSVEDIKITEVGKEWSEQQKLYLNQLTLGDKEVYPLEKIPYEFRFKFKCNHPNCKGHTILNTDWELIQTYRNFKRIYGEEKGLDLTKDRYISMFNKSTTDTYFIVGTPYLQHRFCKFIIIGYVDLPRTDYEQLSLYS